MTRSNADGRDAASAASGADASAASRAAGTVKAPAVPPPLPPLTQQAARTSGTQVTAAPVVVTTETAPVSQRTSSLSAYSRVGRRSSSGMAAAVPVSTPLPSPAVVGPKAPHSRPSISQDALNLGPSPSPSSRQMPVAAPAGPPPLQVKSGTLVGIAPVAAPSPAAAANVQTAPIVQPPPLPPTMNAAMTASPVAPSAPEAPAPASPVVPVAAVAPAAPVVMPAPVVSAAPQSVRPPAPEPFVTSGETESIAQTFDRLLGSELDSRFAEIRDESERPTASGDPGGVHESDLAEVRNLFEELAANHVRQVRDFLIDLKWAEASRDWIAICEPAVRSLMRGAEKLGLDDLGAALGDFGQGLSEAAADGAPMLEGVVRDRLLASYDKLIEILPKAFALDMDRTQREAVIVQALLLQIPEVRKVIVDRLYAAGLNSLGVLVLAKADELAVATGIPIHVAERIVEKFQTYRHDLNTASPDATRAQERSAIEAMVEELAKQHEAFEQASTSWSNEAADEKKRLRNARHKTLMQINVALARLGEVGRLHEIEKLPFARKVERLRSYLKDAQEMYVAAL